MIKSGTENNFDILRLLLAILVFFAHWNILTDQNISNPMFHLSGYAVDMFFIVSGFLIFWSFQNDQSKKHFYIKRFFRIFPLYAILIILQTLFFIIVSDTTFFEIVKYFVSNILFLNFLSPSVGTTLGNLNVDAINGSLWTLKNEVIFYATVPLIFFLYKKWGIGFLLLVYMCSVIYMFGVTYIGIEKLLVQFPGQLRLFIIGILLYVLLDKIEKNKIYLTLFLSIAVMIYFGNNPYFKFTFYPLVLGILVVFLVFYVQKINISFDFSYSFYILHFPVIQIALFFEINPGNPLVSFLVLFMSVIFLSFLSEKYIEKKFVQIGKKLIRKEQNESH